MLFASSIVWEEETSSSEETTMKSLTDESAVKMPSEPSESQAEGRSVDCSVKAPSDSRRKTTTSHLRATTQPGRNKAHGFGSPSYQLLESPKTQVQPMSGWVATGSSAVTFASKQRKSLASDTAPVDRLERSRERNRHHARKTRQRKKQQMAELSTRAEELKEEQVRLKQIINEKNTASILLGLFSTSNESGVEADPQVEDLLRRTTEEIPDSSQIPELPALILPGQHASKKLKATSGALKGSSDDGIDYELLGKDRSSCTPEELDLIRKERNRWHAKRTRERKRLFLEKVAEVCRRLEDENDLLRSHLVKIDPEHEECQQPQHQSSIPVPLAASPRLLSVSSPKLLPLAPKIDAEDVSATPSMNPQKKSGGGVTFDQINTLLRAATSFESQSRKRPVDDAFASISSDDDTVEPSLIGCNKRTKTCLSAMPPATLGC